MSILQPDVRVEPGPISVGRPLYHAYTRKYNKGVSYTRSALLDGKCV